MLSWFKKNSKIESVEEHTEIPDLSLFTYRHVLELSFDKSLPVEFEAIAIGWLGSSVPSVGDLDSLLFQKLKLAHKNQKVDGGLLGYHTCRLCNSYDDRGEFLIEFGSKRYVLPSMIIHYISEHRYLPPEEFLSDLAAVDL